MTDTPWRPMNTPRHDRPLNPGVAAPADSSYASPEAVAVARPHRSDMAGGQNPAGIQPQPVPLNCVDAQLGVYRVQVGSPTDTEYTGLARIPPSELLTGHAKSLKSRARVTGLQTVHSGDSPFFPGEASAESPRSPASFFGVNGRRSRYMAAVTIPSPPRCFEHRWSTWDYPEGQCVHCGIKKTASTEREINDG